MPLLARGIRAMGSCWECCTPQPHLPNKLSHACNIKSLMPQCLVSSSGAAAQQTRQHGPRSACTAVHAGLLCFHACTADTQCARICTHPSQATTTSQIRPQPHRKEHLRSQCCLQLSTTAGTAAVMPSCSNTAGSHLCHTPAQMMCDPPACVGGANPGCKECIMQTSAA